MPPMSTIELLTSHSAYLAIDFYKSIINNKLSLGTF